MFTTYYDQIFWPNNLALGKKIKCFERDGIHESFTWRFDIIGGHVTFWPNGYV